MVMTEGESDSSKLYLLILILTRISTDRPHCLLGHCNETHKCCANEVLIVFYNYYIYCDSTVFCIIIARIHVKESISDYCDM